jgi:hypothetical protein
MKYCEALIAWTPTTDALGEIDVLPWPDKRGLSDRYEFTGDACYSEVHQMSQTAQLARLFIDFNTVVVRDRIPVAAAHRAFLKIDEYRDRISPDTDGAA